MCYERMNIEIYLNDLQVEILRLRAVVAALYHPENTQQSFAFSHYEALLDRKSTDYMMLREAL